MTRLTLFNVAIALYWRRETSHHLWEVTAMGSDLVSTPFLVQLIPEIRHWGCKGIILNCTSLGRLASSWSASSPCIESLKGRPGVIICSWGSKTPNVDLWENRTPK